MALKSLNLLKPLRGRLVGLRRAWLRRIRGIDLADNVGLSLTARFVSGARGSISIGHTSVVAFKSMLISRELDGTVRPIRIGANCFVGGGSVVLPGVEIGDNSIVGAGAVVSENVPPNAIAVGNPARIVAREVAIGAFGRLPEADDNSRRYWDPGS